MGTLVRRPGSINSGRGPDSRLCMWTMKAMPNKGVARLTIGIDTILYGRVAMYAEDFRVRLLAGDVSAAKAIGLDPALLANRPPGPPDEAAVAFVRPMVEKASLALCVNEAWAMLACVAIAGLLLVPFARDRTEPGGN